MVSFQVTLIYYYYDSEIRYNEAAAVLKGSQDLPWQASALEGMAIAGFLEIWASAHSTVCS